MFETIVNNNYLLLMSNQAVNFHTCGINSSVLSSAGVLITTFLGTSETPFKY